MERKLATIRKIKEIRQIEGADNIECIIIDGWQCVAKKNEFSVDNPCIYVEIDSILPEIEAFEFLRKYNFRIKTQKLRGQISQGICFPLSILNNINGIEFLPIEVGTYDNIKGMLAPDVYGHITIENSNEIISLKIGTDVSDILGIVKYDPSIPAQLSGISKGNFPSFLIKTDQERCLSEDSEILTEDGIKTIKSICDNNYKGKVKSYNEIFNKIEWNSIKSHSIINNNNDWYEIETKLGYKIKATSNHKIYIPSLKCYREIKDLNINDDILIFSEKN